MHWNKALDPADYEDLVEEVALVNAVNKGYPEWMFIHSQALHRRWEYASMYRFFSEHLPEGSCVLEFGSAASPYQATPMAPLMALKGMNVIASDMVPWFSMGINKQRELFNIPLQGILQDGRHMAIKSESVDLVCSISVIEHIERDLEVFEESARVVSPGGYIAFTCDFNVSWGYDRERLEERVSFLEDRGFNLIDKPDYSSMEQHVLWNGTWFNFARCFMRKE